MAMIEYTLKIKVLTDEIPDIQPVLDRMLADGRIALVTEHYDLDVVEVRLHGSRPGRRYRTE